MSFKEKGLVSFNKKIINYNNQILIMRPLIGQKKNDLIFL